MSTQRLRESYEELEAWHKEHGMDMALLFQERPELFRVLLEHPGFFRRRKLGKEYCVAAASVASKAEKKKVYQTVFAPRSAARTTKEEVSIGLLPFVGRRRRVRRSQR